MVGDARYYGSAWRWGEREGGRGFGLFYFTLLYLCIYIYVSKYIHFLYTSYTRSDRCIYILTKSSIHRGRKQVFITFHYHQNYNRSRTRGFEVDRQAAK